MRNAAFLLLAIIIFSMSGAGRWVHFGPAPASSQVSQSATHSAGLAANPALNCHKLKSLLARGPAGLASLIAARAKLPHFDERLQGTAEEFRTDFTIDASSPCRVIRAAGDAGQAYIACTAQRFRSLAADIEPCLMTLDGWVEGAAPNEWVRPTGLRAARIGIYNDYDLDTLIVQPS